VIPQVTRPLFSFELPYAVQERCSVSIHHTKACIPGAYLQAEAESSSYQNAHLITKTQASHKERMGAAARQAKKKKRIAAHIKQAAEQRQQKGPTEGEDVHVPVLGVKRARPAAATAAAAAAAASEAPAAKKGSSAARSAREISEGKQYLRAWQQKQNGQDSGWKFSKKVQTWLLQNVYNDAKVDKKDFAVLCLYLEGMQGSARHRLAAEARAAIEKYAPFLDADAKKDSSSSDSDDSDSDDSEADSKEKDGFQFSFGDDEKADGKAAAAAPSEKVDNKRARLMHDRALQVAEVLA
jgi:WKF domain